MSCLYKTASFHFDFDQHHFSPSFTGGNGNSLLQAAIDYTRTKHKQGGGFNLNCLGGAGGWDMMGLGRI